MAGSISELPDAILNLVLDSGLLDEREPQEHAFHFDSLRAAALALPRVAAQLMESLAGPNYERASHRL